MNRWCRSDLCEVTEYTIGLMELLTTAHHTGEIMVNGCEGLLGIAPAAAMDMTTLLISKGPVAVTHSVAVGTGSAGPGNPLVGMVA